MKIITALPSVRLVFWSKYFNKNLFNLSKQYATYYKWNVFFYIVTVMGFEGDTTTHEEEDNDNTVQNIFKICYHNIFSFVKSTL